jgi:PAS domain S-box-containing protein
LIKDLSVALETAGTAPLPAMPVHRAAPQRSELEHQLLESEERFRGMFEDAPVACHEIDRNGVVLRVNRAECKLLGFEPEEMVGRRIWEFMAAEEEKGESQDAVRRKISEEQALVSFEREYVRRDGATVVLEIHPKLIRDAEDRAVGIRSFLLDVTARKRAEQELHRRAEELARSNSELEQFAYVASHDLQEPLRKILAFSDRLKTKHGEALGDDARDYLVRMQSAAARMQTLIHDLLSLSRVASHAQSFVAVDLAEVVHTVVSDLESRLEESGGKVDVGPLPIIIADRGQIAQLFQNLIGNGLKFSKPGVAPVVKIYGELRRHAGGSPETCEIVIEDNGIGFDEKYSEKIFRVFQRLHGRGQYEGTGIGLAICRKIVERHGGTIAATSTPGSGAKFTVHLPYRPNQENQHETHQETK